MIRKDKRDKPATPGELAATLLFLAALFIFMFWLAMSMQEHHFFSGQ
jgi:hypothetical protein